jgi:hypothetical protein
MFRRVVSAACLIAGLLAPVALAHAQGCVLCYTSALAAGKGVEDALRNGVLVLLIPVALLLVAVAVMVWRRAAPAATR